MRQITINVNRRLKRNCRKRSASRQTDTCVNAQGSSAFKILRALRAADDIVSVEAAGGLRFGIGRDRASMIPYHSPLL